MKNTRHLLLALALGPALLLPACTTSAETDAHGLTAAESAAAGPPPEPGMRWRKGRYTRRGMNWIYVPGQWIR